MFFLVLSYCLEVPFVPYLQVGKTHQSFQAKPNVSSTVPSLVSSTRVTSLVFELSLFVSYLKHLLQFLLKYGYLHSSYSLC